MIPGNSNESNQTASELVASRVIATGINWRQLRGFFVPLMSNQPRTFIPIWLDDMKLHPSEFRVFCHLSRRADIQTGVAWPSLESIAEHCGLSRRTVVRALATLETQSLIEKIGKPFGGSTRYQIKGFAIVPPETSLEDSNSAASDTIGDTPIVPPQHINSATTAPPIVPLETREGKPKKVNQGRGTNKKADEPLPLPFDSPEFTQAWGDWQQHRKEKKAPLTPTSIKRQFADMTKWGESKAIAAMNSSIASGWTGIFEPRDTYQPSAAKPAIAPLDMSQDARYLSTLNRP